MSLFSAIKPNSRIYSALRTSLGCVRRTTIPIRDASTSMREPDQEDFDANKPIKYLSSEAGSWKARSSRLHGTQDMLSYQPYVVVASTAIFLIYFCILREENDIDEELGKSLYERVPDVEKQHLLQLHQKYLNDGRDVTQIEKRLKEILIDEKKRIPIPNTPLPIKN